jgi:hypothetical protein
VEVKAHGQFAETVPGEHRKNLAEAIGLMITPVQPE